VKEHRLKKWIDSFTEKTNLIIYLVTLMIITIALIFKVQNKIYSGLPDMLFSLVGVGVLSIRIINAFREREIYQMNWLTILTIFLLVSAQFFHYFESECNSLLGQIGMAPISRHLYLFCSIAYKSLLFILILLLLYSYQIMERRRKLEKCFADQSVLEKSLLDVKTELEKVRLERENLKRINEENKTFPGVSHEYKPEISFRLSNASDNECGFVLTRKESGQTDFFPYPKNPVIFQKFFRLAILKKFIRPENPDYLPGTVAQLVKDATGAREEKHYNWKFEDKDKEFILEVVKAKCPDFEKIFLTKFRENHTRYHYLKLPSENIVLPDADEINKISDLTAEKVFDFYYNKYSYLRRNR
jgi:hypothetical protein